jgi:hypothetical protein
VNNQLNQADIGDSIHLVATQVAVGVVLVNKFLNQVGLLLISADVSSTSFFILSQVEVNCSVTLSQ